MTKAPAPERVKRFSLAGELHPSRAAATRRAKELEGHTASDVAEVDVELMFDVNGSADGHEGRYATEALAREHVDRLEAQAGGPDWRGPRPTWEITPVEVPVGAEG